MTSKPESLLYSDSFEIVLPEYVLKNQELEERLDSLILLANSCLEFYENNPLYPVFLVVNPAEVMGEVIFDLTASNSYTFVFLVSGDDLLSLGRDQGFGVVYYNGFYVKLEGNPRLYSFRRNKTPEGEDQLEYLVVPTEDTLRFWGYGSREKGSQNWVLENFGWIRNGYSFYEGTFNLKYSKPCLSGF